MEILFGDHTIILINNPLKNPEKRATKLLAGLYDTPYSE